MNLEKKNFARDLNTEINSDLEYLNENYIQNTLKNTNINEIIETLKSNKKFFRVVLSRPEIYDIVCYTFYHYPQWSELPHGLSLGNCWNVLWTYGAPNLDFTKIFSFQKVNHLINNRNIHRKDLLQKHINRIRNLSKKLNEIFDIMPKTFLLSKEYMNFVEVS